jgi:hypothetical protein
MTTKVIHLFGNVEKAFETLNGSSGKGIFNKLSIVTHKNVELKILMIYFNHVIG